MVESDPSDSFICVGELTESAMIPNDEENICWKNNKIVFNIYNLIGLRWELSDILEKKSFTTRHFFKYAFF